MAFANVLETVGASGKFQVLHVCFLSLFVLNISCHFVGHVFLAATPQHHCRVPWLENASLEAPWVSSWNLSKESLLRVAIPWEQDSPSKCSRYVRPQWQLLLNDSADVSDDIEIEGCVDGWEFDTSEFSSTIVMEWDLVCKNRALKEMTQSAFMGGVLVGALIFGGLADKYGRRNMILICDFLAAIMGICTSLAPNITLFTIARFFTGLCLNGSYINGFSLGLEWMRTNHRVLFTKCMAYSYTTGQLILVALAYGFYGWRHLSFVIAFPLLVIFCLAWFHPESARWLIHQGRYDDALKSLRRVAKINGKSLAEDFHNKEVLLLKLDKENEEVQTTTYTFLDLFRTRRLGKNTLIMMFLWFAAGFSYYGLALNLQGFGVNIYILMVIFAAIDFPSKFLILLVINHFGRRAAGVSSLLLAGITCIIFVLMPAGAVAVRTAMAVIGKGALSSSFTTIYLWVGETFPTVLRQNAYGLSSMMARVGAMISPLVILLKEHFFPLPQLIYGSVALSAGLVAILLPETRNMPLPDTIEEILQQNQHHKTERVIEQEESNELSPRH
uniref:Major facilitator superfamily (MFS) profile domain-containing protein n=1 Tax=Eptatretus burgeri TaxID=7764 RepID=A0A8C4R149_EPTBU